MEYDETYSNIDNFFGVEPVPILRNYYHMLNKYKPILDIGVGQGRNALFFARKGFVVDAIDPSKVAINTVSAIAVKEGLPIHTCQCSFDTFIPQTDFYSGILIFGLIQILSWESIELLLEKVKIWTKEGSLIFVTGFTTADPSFSRYLREWKTIGKNSFMDKQGNIRTYLEAGEILNLFSEFNVIYHWEGMGPEHRHGDGPLHIHGKFEVALQK
ncbi:class I SAM-dependent methyltransferase [candidate division KSB1 bacterium]|nr:class I SAM-dependent methyltransferase [candidate division KSB1 bacterium]